MDTSAVEDLKIIISVLIIIEVVVSGMKAAA